MSMLGLGLAGTIIGTGLKAIGQNEARDAQNEAFQRGQSIDAGLYGEQNALYGDTLNRFDPVARRMATDRVGVTRGAYFKTALPPIAAFMPRLPGSASRVVSQGYGSALAATRSGLDQEAMRLGQATAAPEMAQYTDQLLSRAAARNALLASFRKRNADASAAEVRSAEAEGSGTRAAGDIIGGVGNALTSIGLFG